MHGLYIISIYYLLLPIFMFYMYMSLFFLKEWNGGMELERNGAIAMEAHTTDAPAYNDLLKAVNDTLSVSMVS